MLQPRVAIKRAARFDCCLTFLGITPHSAPGYSVLTSLTFSDIIRAFSTDTREALYLGLLPALQKPWLKWTQAAACAPDERKSIHESHTQSVVIGLGGRLVVDRRKYFPAIGIRTNPRHGGIPVDRSNGYQHHQGQEKEEARCGLCNR